MFGAILKATNSSFQKGMPFCRSIYIKKDMKLLAFIFEQPSYKFYLTILIVLFINASILIVLLIKFNASKVEHNQQEIIFSLNK